MKGNRTNLSRLAAAAAILALGAGPSLAQSQPLPCSAFARNASGGWRVTDPVMLDLGGTLLAPMVGTSFAAGSTMHGIAMSELLDRDCGNLAR